MKLKLPLFLIALLCVSIPLSSFAGKGITSPYVTKGKHTITHDGYYSIDEAESKNGDYRTRVSLDGGLTDKLAYRIRYTGEEKGSKDYRFMQAELGFKYQLADEGVLPLDLALYLVYETRPYSGASDAFNFRFIYGKKWDHWRTWGNIFIEPEVGDNSRTTDFELRHRVQHYPQFDLNLPIENITLPQNAWYVAADYYGDFGDIDRMDDSSDNAHQLGAAFGTPIPGTDLKTEFSYVTKVSGNAPDHMLKWKFSYGF